MVLVFIGPKANSAWRFSAHRGVRRATCLNDGFVVTLADGTNASLVQALQALAAHTVSVSGAPTLVVEVPW
jgi:hypothetical protein